jgi:excisionase family DNA binding protein
MNTSPQDEILTVEDVAKELRSSKAHVYNLINGKVPGVMPLPVIALGRKKLIRRSSLQRWLRINENEGILPPLSEIGPVRRMEEERHA